MSMRASLPSSNTTECKPTCRAASATDTPSANSLKNFAFASVRFGLLIREASVARIDDSSHGSCSGYEAQGTQKKPSLLGWGFARPEGFALRREPRGLRTPDPRIRRAKLYPAEEWPPSGPLGTATD